MKCVENVFQSVSNQIAKYFSQMGCMYVFNRFLAAKKLRTKKTERYAIKIIANNFTYVFCAVHLHSNIENEVLCYNHRIIYLSIIYNILNHTIHTN